MSYPKKVKLVEVGPRDGLQNEKRSLTVAQKTELIHRLEQAGLKNIEVGSFVSPKWVPQMAHTEDVFDALEKNPAVSYPILVPNQKGFEKAVSLGVREIAIFASATESFSQKNINKSIADSLEVFDDICDQAIEHEMKVRGYVSCVMGCPYEGRVSPQKVHDVVGKLIQMGCYEVSLGDTIGVGTAGDTQKLFDALLTDFPADKLAMHFHDTYGQALANILVGLQMGVATIDTAVGGLGGCPYAPGASGNVATEDVVYMLNGLDIETGVKIEKLVEASEYIFTILEHRPFSKVANTLMKEEKVQQTEVHEAVPDF